MMLFLLNNVVVLIVQRGFQCILFLLFGVIYTLDYFPCITSGIMMRSDKLSWQKQKSERNLRVDILWAHVLPEPEKVQQSQTLYNECPCVRCKLYHDVPPVLHTPSSAAAFSRNRDASAPPKIICPEILFPFTSRGETVNGAVVYRNQLQPMNCFNP